MKGTLNDYTWLEWSDNTAGFLERFFLFAWLSTWKDGRDRKKKIQLNQDRLQSVSRVWCVLCGGTMISPSNSQKNTLVFSFLFSFTLTFTENSFAVVISFYLLHVCPSRPLNSVKKALRRIFLHNRSGCCFFPFFYFTVPGQCTINKSVLFSFYIA